MHLFSKIGLFQIFFLLIPALSVNRSGIIENNNEIGTFINTNTNTSCNSCGLNGHLNNQSELCCNNTNSKINQPNTSHHFNSYFNPTSICNMCQRTDKQMSTTFRCLSCENLSEKNHSGLKPVFQEVQCNHCGILGHNKKSHPNCVYAINNDLNLVKNNKQNLLSSTKIPSIQTNKKTQQNCDFTKNKDNDLNKNSSNETTNDKLINTASNLIKLRKRKTKRQKVNKIIETKNTNRNLLKDILSNQNEINQLQNRQNENITIQSNDNDTTIKNEVPYRLTKNNFKQSKKTKSSLKNKAKFFIEDFDSTKNGEMHNQPFVLDAFDEFDKVLYSLKQFYCFNCKEMWPTDLSLIPGYDMCPQCKKNKIKFSVLNNMVHGLDDLPLDVKIDLEQLTMVEEMLIMPIIPLMTIFRLPNGALVHRGFCANFQQDITPLTRLLPRLPKDVPLLILKHKDQSISEKEFLVNRHRVENCLRYLCKNNQAFIDHKITIDESVLTQLPIDGIPIDLPFIDDNNCKIDSFISNNDINIDNNEIIDQPINCYLDTVENTPKQLEFIKNTINFPIVDKKPLNEFEMQSICSLVFFKIFPNGAGDPTNKCRQIEIKENIAVKHLLKSVAKHSNGSYYYPFAQHPRFKFWMNDRIRRHRLLNQNSIYYKVHPNDLNLTIEDLKNSINSPDQDAILNRMSAFTSNITGSSSYWKRRRTELEETFDQKKSATVFFTFSYADNHWLDLHRLMPRNYGIENLEKLDLSHKTTDVIANPHLTDWYFGFRLETFMRIFFDELMDTDWRWHRMEYQARIAIHAHGAARFKNDPGLIELTKHAYIGQLSQKQLNENKYENEEHKLNLNKLVRDGLIAEKKVITYSNTLLTAMNGRMQKGYPLIAKIPTPHPCSYRTATLDKNELEIDYDILSTCIQRHVCDKDSNYCRTSNNKEHCRFDFPFELQPITKLNFIETENTVKASILFKRNDELMNTHNRTLFHAWRANVDLKVILDRHAAIAYMVKYATKGEKASNNLTNLFKDIIINATDTDDPKSKITSIMMRSMSGKKDMGACEVSRHLLMEPLYHSDFTYVTLNTDLTKRKININKNTKTNTPAFQETIIDFYKNRFLNSDIKNLLNDVDNLMDFSKKFEIVNHNNKSILKERVNPNDIVIIGLPRFRLNKSNYEKYCFHQCIKFIPWTVDDLDKISDIKTATERWETFLENAPDHFKEKYKFDQDLSIELNKARKKVVNIEEPLLLKQDSWMMLSDLKSQTDDIININEINIDSTYDWCLNAKKYNSNEILNMKNWIKQQLDLHNEINQDEIILNVDVNSLNKRQKFCYNLVEKFIIDKKQLLLIINGVAGTGKTYVIKAISNLIGTKYHKRCAPTAKASYLISGDTVHRTFLLPINDDKTNDNIYSELNGDQLKDLQKRFNGITHIIIDEYSMLSQYMLFYISKRLGEATGKRDLLFGGLSILLVGDPGQLEPVFGDSLHTFPSKCTEGFYLYQHFKKVINLTKIERQINNTDDIKQAYFIDLLNRTRNGMVDKDYLENDWNFLMNNNKQTPENSVLFNNAMRLFIDNKSCNSYNIKKLNQLNSPITEIIAKNSTKYAKRSTEEHFNNLPNFLYLSIGARIIMTANIWTTKGLVNGAPGYVRDIIYDEDKTLPHTIFIEFDNYSGPRFFPINDPLNRYNWIPISPKIQINKSIGTRTQYPFKLAYASTVHKIQGMTLDKVVIDLGPNERSLGLSYVALSRVKNYKDFLIVPFSKDRLEKISTSKILSNRINEFNLLNAKAEHLLIEYSYLNH